MKSKSGKFQKTKIFFWIIFLLIILIGIYGNFFFYQQYHKNKIESLKSHAYTIASLMEDKDISALSLDDSDLSKPEYKRLKKNLMNIRDYDSESRLIYIVKEKNDKILFVANSENLSSKDYSPPGEEYPEASPVLRGVFKDGEIASEGPLTDRFGNWYSAFAPVTDGTGNIVAVVGIDFSANIQDKTLTQGMLTITLADFLFLFIAIAIYLNKKRDADLLALKEEFITLASHELRSPLTHLRWATSMMLDSAELKDEFKTKIKEMQTTIIRLITMTNSILETTASEHKLIQQASTSTANLKEVIEESLEVTKDRAEEEGIKIDIKPALPKDMMIAGDGEKLALAFTNILSNAIKYSKKNGDVQISWRTGNKKVEVTIKDSGIGIAQEELKYIFTGFYRAKSALDSKVRGSGFGLYMTKKIIEFNKGVIECTSEVGKGTTFIITLNLV